MPTKARLVIFPVLLISVSSISFSFMGFVDRILFITWYMCKFSVAALSGRYVFTSFTVSPGYDWKYICCIFLVHVYLTGLNAAAWRYLTKTVLFVVCCVMLILCYISLSSCVLLFSKGDPRNTLYLALVLVKIMFSSFMM